MENTEVLSRPLPSLLTYWMLWNLKMWVREGLEIPLTVNTYCYGQKMVTGHKEDLQIIICGALKIKWLTAPHSDFVSHHKKTVTKWYRCKATHKVALLFISSPALVPKVPKAFSSYMGDFLNLCLLMKHRSKMFLYEPGMKVFLQAFHFTQHFLKVFQL